MHSPYCRHLLTLAVWSLLVPMASAHGQTTDAIRAQVAQEKASLLDTLRDLVNIESGSRDIDGLNRISDLIATRLRALGASVEFVAPGNDARFDDTPAQIGRMVLARFQGTGTKKILLLAHMDTVYEKGMSAQQPFRIDGDRAYGLGIADDKHGVAVILHTLAALRALNVQSYGLLTILINGDEEISSPGSRTTIARLAGEHDAVFSFEGGGATNESIRLATSGNGDVLLRVTGRASHAGGAPELGRNALTELAHQILQMQDLSIPEKGIKLNWTVASAGTVRNIIPSSAQAMADVRVQRVEDWDLVEALVRQRVVTTRVPDTKVEFIVERRRPPLQVTPGSRAVADQAVRIYTELGKTLAVTLTGTGGGTDAAIAQLGTRAPVVEGLGLTGGGAHSSDREYINISSIEPRIYLVTRLVMDISLGQIPAEPSR